MYFTVFIPLSWSSFTFISSIKIEKKIGHKCAKDYVPFALTDTTDIASLHHCSLEYFIESFYTFNYLTVDVEYQTPNMTRYIQSMNMIQNEIYCFVG